MMKKVLLSVLVMFCASALIAQAQDVVPMLQKGTKELVAEGDFDFDGSAGSTLDISLALGYFIADQFQVGGRAGIFDDDFSTDYRLGAFAEYNFNPKGRFVPFVGASLGWTIFDPDLTDDDSESTMFASGNAGVKYFLASNVAISLAYTLIWSEEDIFYEDGELTDTDHLIKLGMRFFF